MPIRKPAHAQILNPSVMAHITASVMCKQTTQHSASGGFNDTHIDYIDVVVIRQSFQHFTNRGPDQLQSQSRHTSTSASRKELYCQLSSCPVGFCFV